MDKLSELSKPVAWFTDDYLTDKSATTYSEEMAQRWRDKPWFVGNLYSQEYVSALLSQIEADKEIKARLCRESNSLHDRLKTSEKRIAELEVKLATPVRLPELCGDGENDNEYTEGLNDGINQSAKAVRAAGFTVEGDEQ